jgi:hypothetical protein
MASATDDNIGEITSAILENVPNTPVKTEVEEFLQKILRTNHVADIEKAER